MFKTILFTRRLSHTQFSLKEKVKVCFTFGFIEQNMPFLPEVWLMSEWRIFSLTTTICSTSSFKHTKKFFFYVTPNGNQQCEELFTVMYSFCNFSLAWNRQCLLTHFLPLCCVTTSTAISPIPIHMSLWHAPSILTHCAFSCGANSQNEPFWFAKPACETLCKRKTLL